MYKVANLASTGRPQMASVWNHRPECRNPKIEANYKARQAIERKAGGSKPSINAI
jgi:hypothetical protein